VVACSLELGAIFSVWHRDLAKIVVSRGMQVPENAQMMGQQNQKQQAISVKHQQTSFSTPAKHSGQQSPLFEPQPHFRG